MKAKFLFNPFPELQTKRLLLRQMEKSDAAEIFELRNNDIVNRFIDRPKAKTIEDANHFIGFIQNEIVENNSLYWAIQFLENKSLIGTICLWNFSADNKTAEIGFELLPALQGFGLMDEALKAIIDYAFTTCQIEKLEAFSQVGNEKSGLLLQRNNFKKASNIKSEEGFSYHIYLLEKP